MEKVRKFEEEKKKGEEQKKEKANRRRNIKGELGIFSK